MEMGMLLGTAIVLFYTFLAGCSGGNDRLHANDHHSDRDGDCRLFCRWENRRRGGSFMR